MIKLKLSWITGLLILSASTLTYADPELTGVLRGVHTNDGVIGIDAEVYKYTGDIAIRNFDGNDSLSALQEGQPVKYKLDPNGMIIELWAYPADPRKPGGGINHLDGMH